LSDPNSSKEEILSLYDLYSNDIYRYAYSGLGNSSEAYDAVQEVFLRAHRKTHKFRRGSSSKTWLMAITRNYIIDVIRKQQRDRKHVSNQQLPELTDESISMDTVMEIRDALSLEIDSRKHGSAKRNLGLWGSGAAAVAGIAAFIIVLGGL
jgi:RNA polymerase sigma factor (sigma-70 family)